MFSCIVLFAMGNPISNATLHFQSYIHDESVWTRLARGDVFKIMIGIGW